MVSYLYLPVGQILLHTHMKYKRNQTNSNASLVTSI